MSLTYRYKAVTRPNGTLVKSPSIPVTFHGDKESFETLALIDSGEDISFISKDIGEILGLKTKGDGSTAYGIGGKIKTVEKKVTLSLGKGRQRHRIRLPIKVALEPYDFPPLLGRLAFFDHFEITFNQQQEKIQMKKQNIKKY